MSATNAAIPICTCVSCPVHRPSCGCIFCPPHQPPCTCARCPAHRPQGTLPAPLPLNSGDVHGITEPRHRWDRQQRDAGEGPSSGYGGSSHGVSEPTQSTSSYVDGRGTNLPSIHSLGLPGLRRVSDQQPGPSNDYMGDYSNGVSEPTQSTSNNVDGRGTNLPGIHTLGLLGLRRVSDQQPGPSNPVPSLATPTTHYQVPSPQHHIFSVPEQDSPYESQDESSGDSSDMDSEDTQSGGSSPLSSDLDEQGSGLTWRTFGPSEFAHRVPQFR